MNTLLLVNKYILEFFVEKWNRDNHVAGIVTCCDGQHGSISGFLRYDTYQDSAKYWYQIYLKTNIY